MTPAFAHSDGAWQMLAGLWAARLSDDFPIEVGLFINDYTPVPGWVIGDIVEPGVAGYARQTIGVGGAWASGVVDHVGIVTASDAVRFTTTDIVGELCYGYFVNDASGGQELWVQRFETPLLLVFGVPITFTVRDKFKDCPD